MIIFLFKISWEIEKTIGNVEKKRGSELAKVANSLPLFGFDM